MIAWMPVHTEQPEALQNVLIYTGAGRVHVAHLWQHTSHTAPPAVRLWWRLHHDNRDLRFDEVTHWAVLNVPVDAGVGCVEYGPENAQEPQETMHDANGEYPAFSENVPPRRLCVATGPCQAWAEVWDSDRKKWVCRACDQGAREEES